MNRLPSIHGHFESPIRHISLVERFETNVFPDCHTVTKEWRIGKNPFNKRRQLVLIHHAPTCKYSVVAIREEAEQLRFQNLSQ